MRKTYVIDTNVLIQSPDAIEHFEDNQVIIPLVVIEELDGLKNAEGEKGANARFAIRLLDKYRQKGDLTVGIDFEQGGNLRVEKNFIDVELPPDLPDSKMDNRILKVCKGLSVKEEKVILVTKDILLRIKAQILGIQTEDYTTEQVPSEYSQYTGRCEAYVDETAFKEFKKSGIESQLVYQVDSHGNRLDVKLTTNEFIILKADESNKKTQLGRFDGEKIVPLNHKKSRPNVQFDNEIGFLPGTEQKKYHH